MRCVAGSVGRAANEKARFANGNGRWAKIYTFSAQSLLSERGRRRRFRMHPEAASVSNALLD